MAKADGHKEQWKTVKLGDVAKTFTGLTYSPNCIDKRGTLVLRSSNIKDGRLCFEDNVFVSMEIPERAIVQENDILICVRNGSRNLIGKCALITKDAVGMAFGAFMTVLRSNTIDPKLLLYIWQSNSIQRQVANNIGATINQITNADFNRFEISYPDSLPAQRRIAAILSSADKVIEQTRLLISKYKSIKQGMMEDLLKPKEGWKKVKLGECLTIGNGQDYKHLQSGVIPVYGTGGVMTYVDDYLYEGETVCIGRKGTINKPMYYSGKIWTVDTLFYTHSFIGVMPLFIYYIFCNIDWNKYNEATGVPSLSKETIYKIELSIPDLPEQRRIAKILSGIDRKIEVEEKVLEKYIQIKKGLMEKLLREQ